ncbi:MAG: hypothetical protein ACLPX5_06235 [Dissulfurispiraceae bacterium]
MNISRLLPGMPDLKSPCRSGADNSYGKELLKLISPHLLVIDNFGLQKLTDEQAGDF